jgi:hypothetical protein
METCAWRSAEPPAAGCGCRRMWPVVLWGAVPCGWASGGVVDGASRCRTNHLRAGNSEPSHRRAVPLRQAFCCSTPIDYCGDTIVSAESADRFRRKGWPFAPGRTTRCWYAPPWQRRSLQPSRVGGACMRPFSNAHRGWANTEVVAHWRGSQRKHLLQRLP